MKRFSLVVFFAIILNISHILSASSSKRYALILSSNGKYFSCKYLKDGEIHPLVAEVSKASSHDKVLTVMAKIRKDKKLRKEINFYREKTKKEKERSLHSYTTLGLDIGALEKYVKRAKIREQGSPVSQTSWVQEWENFISSFGNIKIR